MHTDNSYDGHPLLSMWSSYLVHLPYYLVHTFNSDPTYQKLFKSHWEADWYALSVSLSLFRSPHFCHTEGGMSEGKAWAQGVLQLVHSERRRRRPVWPWGRTDRSRLLGRWVLGGSDRHRRACLRVVQRRQPLPDVLALRCRWLPAGGTRDHQATAATAARRGGIRLPSKRIAIHMPTCFLNFRLKMQR